MNANINDRVEAILRADRELAATFDRTRAEEAAYFENHRRRLTSVAETTNELLSNIMAQRLGGPSREAENAELLARLGQLAASMKAGDCPLAAGREAQSRAFDNWVAEITRGLNEARQTRPPDA